MPLNKETTPNFILPHLSIIINLTLLELFVFLFSSYCQICFHFLLTYVYLCVCVCVCVSVCTSKSQTFINPTYCYFELTHERLLFSVNVTSNIETIPCDKLRLKTPPISINEREDVKKQFGWLFIYL